MNWEQEALLAIRVIVAAVLGAVVGFQRERAGQEAGIRTFAAVALGAPAPQTNAPLCSRCRHPGHGVCNSGHLSSQPAPIS